MRHFVDRRLNPKDKNLGNRQKFMRRAREQIKKVVDDSIKGRSITNVDEGETISIPTKGINEPRFQNSRQGGSRKRVFSGNKDFNTGDKIEKPEQGGAAATAVRRRPTPAKARMNSPSSFRAKNSSISISKISNCRT